MRLKVLLPVMLTVLLAFMSTQNVFAATLDQKQETVHYNATAQILSNDPLGQEFRPTLGTLEAVEVWIDTMNPGGDDTITLTVRQGSVTGAVLATADKSLTQGFSGWVYFTLGAVRVTAGSIYVVRLSATRNTFGWFYSDLDPYPGGMAIMGELGIPEMLPAVDFTFRTYGSISSTVGGILVPTNKLEILTPYLTIAGLMIAVLAVVAVKRRRG